MNCIGNAKGSGSMKQAIRDVVKGELSIEYFAKRFSEGWRLSSIEWSRESGEADVAAESSHLLNRRETLPYGLWVAEDGTVHENPIEATVLLLILDQIVREKRVPEIAGALNSQGYSTRDGLPWTPTDVFNLLPRLIDTGPSLLKSAAWQLRRPAAQRRIEETN